MVNGLPGRVKPLSYTDSTPLTSGSYIGLRTINTRARFDDVQANEMALSYLHGDHLGSNSLMTDAAGAVVPNSQAAYLPFGDWCNEPGTSELTDVGYTGHKHNNTASNDLGLIYMNARYYVPRLARFASADTIVPDPHNPQSYNRFSYVENRPLNFIDPSGHCKDTAYENDYNGCIDWLESSYGIDINIWESEDMRLLWALHESLNHYLSLLGSDLFTATYSDVKFNYNAPTTPEQMNAPFGGIASDGAISFLFNPDIIPLVHQSLGVYDTYLNLVIVFAHELAHFVVNPSGADPLSPRGLPSVFERFIEASGWRHIGPNWLRPLPVDDIEGTQTTYWPVTPYSLVTGSSNPAAEDAAENLAVSLVLGRNILHPASANTLHIVQQVVYDSNWENNYNPKSAIMQ